MPTPTDNHGINDYDPGDASWDHSDLVSQAEERLVLWNATDGASSGLTPHDGAFYIDDSASRPEVYRGNGTWWVLVGTIDAGEPISYSPGHTRWGTGLSLEEVMRFVPPTGEAVTIDTVEFYQKGGGSSTSASLQIYDNGAASELTSVDLGSADRTSYTAQTSATVLVRLTNTTGSNVDAAPVVKGWIA